MTAPDPKRTTRQYSRFVGVAFLIFVLFVAYKAVNGNHRGGKGLEHGETAPEFAAPIAGGSLTGPANIFQNEDEARANHRHRAACEVKVRDALRICDYWKDKPLVLVMSFKVRRCKDCQSQLDQIERASKRYPDVNFVGVDSFDTVGNAGEVVRARHWTFPMAVDEDGFVAGAYRVIVPPATVFIYPGGKAKYTTIGELKRQVLDDDIEDLIRESRRVKRAQQ